MYYAQLDAADKVCTVSENPLLEGPNIVEIQSLDTSLLGKQYNRETGEFEEPPA